MKLDKSEYTYIDALNARNNSNKITKLSEILTPLPELKFHADDAITVAYKNAVRECKKAKSTYKNDVKAAKVRYFLSHPQQNFDDFEAELSNSAKKALYSMSAALDAAKEVINETRETK